VANDNNSSFRTDDGVLATLFVMAGFEHYHLEVTGPYSVAWVFELHPEMDEIAGRYARGGALEEPRRYSRTFNGLRREARDFLRDQQA
jgi:hypothetical protein